MSRLIADLQSYGSLEVKASLTEKRIDFTQLAIEVLIKRR